MKTLSITQNIFATHEQIMDSNSKATALAYMPSPICREGDYICTHTVYSWKVSKRAQRGPSGSPLPKMLFSKVQADYVLSFIPVLKELTAEGTTGSTKTAVQLPEKGSLTQIREVKDGFFRRTA